MLNTHIMTHTPTKDILRGRECERSSEGRNISWVSRMKIKKTGL